MAYSKAMLIQSFVAASDMSAASQQYIFVEMATNGQVHPANAVTDKIVGVLLNRPARAELAEICMHGICPVRVGGTDLSVNDLVTVDTTSRAAAGVAGTATTSYLVGRVIDTDNADNDGKLVTIALNCLSLARGA